VIDYRNYKIDRGSRKPNRREVYVRLVTSVT
jgi:hypothetical protein